MKKNKQEWITTAELSKITGYSRSVLSVWTKSGRLDPGCKKIGRKWFYDKNYVPQRIEDTRYKISRSRKGLKPGEKFSDQEIQTSDDLEIVSSAAGSEKFMTMSGTEATIMQARLKAALLQIELDKESEKVIDAEIVKKEAFDCARMVRDAFLNIPERISPILATEHDSLKISKILKTEIIQVLEEFKKYSGYADAI